MSIMPDTWIIENAQAKGMIEPFTAEQIKTGISFGVSSYGYDFRISDEFQLPRIGGTLATRALDPKAITSEDFEATRTSVLTLASGAFALGRTVEYFRIPREVVTIATGKSTYARCGVTLYITPFEPEWEGYATISIVNSGPRPVKIYAGEGIGQLLFLKGDSVCATSYADKKGKYQAQQTITTAKV